jgi:hypothetical protein
MIPAVGDTDELEPADEAIATPEPEASPKHAAPGFPIRRETPAPTGALDESEAPAPPAPAQHRDHAKVTPTPGVHYVRVTVDDTGKGSGMLGIDHDNITAATAIDPKVRITWGPSHTLSITKIDVSNAIDTGDGTVLVTVEAK